MKIITLGAVTALAALGTAPLAAQPAPPAAGWHNGNGGGPGGWNRDAFWRGAPEGPRERIDWLQQRIDRGIRDGSLDRREARRSQAELNNIRRTTMDLRARDGGRLSPGDRDAIQRRLDDLSQRIRWRRQG